MNSLLIIYVEWFWYNITYKKGKNKDIHVHVI